MGEPTDRMEPTVETAASGVGEPRAKKQRVDASDGDGAAVARKAAKAAKEERRRVVEREYDRLGHATEASVHVWHDVMPEGATDAQIFGAVGAFEKRTGIVKRVAHPPPYPGFQPAWVARRQRSWLLERGRRWET